MSSFLVLHHLLNFKVKCFSCNPVTKIKCENIFLQEAVEQLDIPIAVYFLALLIVLEPLSGLPLATVISFVYSLETVALMLTTRALVSISKVIARSDGKPT